jgi:hypothetical protein
MNAAAQIVIIGGIVLFGGAWVYFLALIWALARMSAWLDEEDRRLRLRQKSKQSETE